MKREVLMRLSRTGLPLFVLGLLIAVTGSSFAAESEARAAVPRDADAFERFGPYPVGVRTLVLVDTSRVDERAGGFRTLVTEVWYPAAPGAADKKPVTFSEFFAPHEEAASRFVRRFRAELEDVDRRFSSRAVRDAPMAEGVFPLLVFSHGNGGVRHQNTFQLDHLASHGYVIASPDHTGNAGIAPLPDRAVLYDRGGRSYAAAERPRDLSFVIDQLLAANTDASSFLHGSLDAEKIGALGHSFGGFTVCRAAEMDSRIRAILPMTVAWGKIVDVPVFVFLAG
ncbi:MAG TPA: alpha/beta fold hydrolase, partial [Planctomycetota bacterium]|nr:alpha/beta fold hydrolase [Planctomycetota bacterium]